MAGTATIASPFHKFTFMDKRAGQVSQLTAIVLKILNSYKARLQVNLRNTLESGLDPNLIVYVNSLLNSICQVAVRRETEECSTLLARWQIKQDHVVNALEFLSDIYDKKLITIEVDAQFNIVVCSTYQEHIQAIVTSKNRRSTRLMADIPLNFEHSSFNCSHPDSEYVPCLQHFNTAPIINLTQLPLLSMFVYEENKTSGDSEFGTTFRTLIVLKSIIIISCLNMKQNWEVTKFCVHAHFKGYGFSLAA